MNRAKNSSAAIAKADFAALLADLRLLGREAKQGAIAPTLSAQLVAEYGCGFEEINQRSMVQFAETFAVEAIVATLWRQSSRAYLRVLLALISETEIVSAVLRQLRWHQYGRRAVFSVQG